MAEISIPDSSDIQQHAMEAEQGQFDMQANIASLTALMHQQMAEQRALTARINALTSQVEQLTQQGPQQQQQSQQGLRLDEQVGQMFQSPRWHNTPQEQPQQPQQTQQTQQPQQQPQATFAPNLQTPFVQFAASQPVFTVSKVKLDLPPKFDGKPKDLQAWLFAVEQYCSTVGIIAPTDKVRLAVSRLERDAFTWWRHFVSQSFEHELGMLIWDDFRQAIEQAFEDVDRELKLRRKLRSLRQVTSVAQYIKEFRQVVLELGTHAPDEGALLFGFVEGLKPQVQLQVLFQRPELLVEAEQLAERADLALMSSQQRNVPRQFGNQRWQQRPRPQQPYRGGFGQQQNRNGNGPQPMELGAVVPGQRN